MLIKTDDFNLDSFPKVEQLKYAKEKYTEYCRSVMSYRGDLEMWTELLASKTVEQNHATKYQQELSKTQDMLKILVQAVILWEKIIKELEAKK
jgi:hypothetical protein